MFDGLRETLGRFRADVEEEIEEPDEEAAEVEPGADDTADAEEATEGRETGGFARRAKSLARGRSVIDESDLEGPLQDLEFALLSNDVELEVAEAILDRVRENLVGETRSLTTRTGSVVEAALRDALLSVVDVGDLDFDERLQAAEKPVVVIFTGVNGVGKTTTIAKVARYLEERGYSTVLANGDTYRAGANEQLREHAENLGVKLISHEQGGDPAAVIYDAVEYAEANDVDVVLGDTAGRLHTSSDLMAQLEKIDRVVDPDMTLFVDEAVAGQDAVQRARQFHEAAAIDGAILTKADADTAGGAAISIAHVTGRPILFLGTGQGYDDLEPFDPEALVDRLLGEG
ncbi:MAG: signal recognition particle-docking protein FtsY [Halobacteriales archaeon]